MKNFTLFYLVAFFVFSLNETTNAQVASKPSLGFTQACAGPSFNSYNLSFSFTPASALGDSNQFIVELSDGASSFSNPTVIYTSDPGALETFTATINFSMPTNVAGEAYRIRIKSTDPASTGTSSDAFPAYYKVQDTPFTINNLIATGAYCSGGSYLLTIDNPGGDSNDSPLKYPSLTYKWYKETSPTESEFVADGETLSVNQPGKYFVKTNYGSCTSNSISNKVSVSEAVSGSTSSINSSLGNPYCSTGEPTILSAINANSYQWFKNDEIITGATSQMYETNETAKYSVNIDLGSCMTNASINLETTGFTSSIDVNKNNYIDENKTLLATVTSNAGNPEYTWYLNNVLINGANNNSFEISQTGSYKVVIKQTTGCSVSKSFQFEVKPLVILNFDEIPNLITPNGDGTNDNWIIPPKYGNGTNTEVVILSSRGRTMFSTNNYQNNWPNGQIVFKDINPVFYYIITTSNGETRKGSITVVK